MKSIRTHLILMVALALIASVCVVPQVRAEDAETREQRNARMQWWREARFGMFIHWGLYAVPAGTYDGKKIGGIGEWIMHGGKIPVARYAEYAKEFNPVKFNAEEWVKIAKDAGMKYIVITSKHHDGFAMFQSKASSYNIYDATPFKRDPLKELAEACKKQGIKLGFYYSQCQDWHHPGGDAFGGHWDKAQDGSFDEYIDKVAIPQVKEILSNYGPVAVLWWDTPTGKMTRERAAKFLPILQELQPNIVYNNRLGGGFSGDTETPEQFIPASGFPGRDWETCMTMNDTWGFKSYDTNFKPTEVLLRNLIDIASKGGNYLLNVGPTAEGLIPQPEVDRLREVGQWLKTNSEAIYGTSAGPFKKAPAWGRVTQKPGKAYLHVFNWPADGKLTVGILNKVNKAYLLTAPAQSLETTSGEGGVVVNLPAAAPDAIASVVVLEIEGEIQAVAAPPVTQAADGSILLAADTAEVIGSTAKVEGDNEPNVGYWTDANDSVQWSVKVQQPGEFEVFLNYACEKGSENSEYTFSFGGQSIAGKVDATGSWKDYKAVKIGSIRLDKPGVLTAAIKPARKPGLAVMNMRSLSLKPVK